MKDTDAGMKWCPFLNKECIGDKCNIYMTIQQQALGVKKQVGVCSLTALVMIMAAKKPPTPPPVQRLDLPNLRR